MSLPTKKTPNDFPFKHSGQADAFGDSKGGNVATIQSDFDNRAIFNQDQINAIITALESDAVDASGAHEIGFGSTQGDIISNNVGNALDEIVTIAKDAQAGTILPNSITNDKLALDNKVGSLALLNTTDKTDAVSAVNELQAEIGENFTNLDILRIVELDTGVADAYVVDTPGTFNRVDGNTLPFIPANDNTGASTMNEDGNGVATIQKYVDGAWAALEEGDLKKFQQTQLVWNASESAFQLAPKGGGSSVKSVQHISALLQTGTSETINITEVVKENSIIIPLTLSKGTLTEALSTFYTLEFTNNTTITAVRGGIGNFATYDFLVVEFDKVKSKQVLTLGSTSSQISANQPITSVDLSKTILSLTCRMGGGTGNSIQYRNWISGFIQSYKLTSPTNLNYATGNWNTGGNSMTMKVEILELI